MTLIQSVVPLRCSLVILVWLVGLVGALAQSPDKRQVHRNERLLRRVEKRMHAAAEREGARMSNMGFNAIFRKGVFANDRTTSSKRNPDPTIMTSKVYADFHVGQGWNRHHCQYGLTVLLNRYQIISADQPSPLHSHSLYVLRPTFAGTHVSAQTQCLEWEYRTSLHLASNPSIERQVEFLHKASPLRVWKSLGWVGQIALRWKLSAPARAKQRHH